VGPDGDEIALQSLVEWRVLEGEVVDTLVVKKMSARLSGTAC
jgi:hypothetical protein